MRTIIGFLAAWALVTIAPDLIRPFAPLGTIGLRSDFSGRVIEVEPAGPAALASVRAWSPDTPGDRIDFERTPADTLFSLYGGLGGRPLFIVGSPARLALVAANGSERDVTLVAVVTHPPPLERIRLFFAELFGIGFVLLAAYLAWTFPHRRDVFGFFLYAIWFNPGENYVVYTIMPAALRAPQEILSALLQATGLAGFMLFALRFPTDRSEGWRRYAERGLPGFVAVLTVLALAGSGAAVGHPNRPLWLLAFWLKAAFFPLIVAAFLTKLRLLAPVDRQRLRLVIYGCIPGLFFYLLAESADATSLWVPLFDRTGWSPPEAWLDLAYLVNALVPISIAYAVVRQRVLPIDFFISRGLTLGAVFVSVAIGVEATLLTAHAFLEHREVVSSTLLAVLFVIFAPLIEWLKDRIHHTADRLLFVRLHTARSSLEAIAGSLSVSTSIAELETAIVEQPVRHVRLASAALFVAGEDGTYRIAAQHDWPATAFTSITAGDEIIAQCVSASNESSVRALVGTRADIPSGLQRPSLIVPLSPGSFADAIAFYSGHADGTALSPDESAILARFVRDCGAVRAHLQSLALRREIALLRQQAGFAQPPALHARSAPAASASDMPGR